MTDREEIINRLNALELSGGSHEMLSSIAKAISPDAMFGWTIGACNLLRARLVNLLSDDEAYQRAFDEGFASADDWCAEHEDEMAEHGWYRALDADSKPVMLGGDVEWRPACGVGETRHGTVAAIKIESVESADVDVLHFAIVNDRGYFVEVGTKVLHRYKPPTVEDVLREFAAQMKEDNWGDMPDPSDDTVAMFAKRLRLAEDED